MDSFRICKILFRDVEYNEEKLEKFSPKIRQVYVALGPLLITTCLGVVQGFSSVLLPQLEKDRLLSDVNVKSWIASIAILPTPFACLVGGIVMEIIGRKYTHMLGALICLLGWIIIYFSSSIPLLLIGRFVTGFCIGFLTAPTCVYLTETTHRSFRGVVLAAITFANALGITISHLLGTFLPWKFEAIVVCIFPILTLIVVYFAPESPTYLSKKDRRKATVDAFYWCRGRDEESENELKEMLQRQMTFTEESTHNVSRYIKPEFWKPLALVIIFAFAYQWSGNNAIIFYNITIMQHTLSGQINENLSMLLMDFVRVIGSLCSCYLLKNFKRRALTVLSCIGVAFSMFFVSSYMYFISIYPHIVVHNYVILIAMLLYIVSYSVGLTPLESVMIGEIFPLRSRGVGSGIYAMANFSIMFSVVKATPWLLLKLKPEVMFSIFGGVAVVSFITIAKLMPETKDKPLHEIEDYFNGIKCNSIELVRSSPHI